MRKLFDNWLLFGKCLNVQHLAGDPFASPEDLAASAKSSDSHVRMLVAGHKNTPLASLRWLAQDKITSVRYAVAGNQTCPSETLRVLAADIDVSVCVAASSNDNQSEERLRELAKHLNPNIRNAVASNFGVTPEILDVLACDSSEWIRAMVAGHPDVPSGALWRLVTDDDPYVRAASAYNVAATDEMLLCLAGDRSSDVCQAVVEREDMLLAEIPGDGITTADIFVGRCQKIDGHSPEESSDVGSASNGQVEVIPSFGSVAHDRAIKTFMARDANAQCATLKQLAGDLDAYIRFMVVQNPNTPTASLHILNDDPHPDVAIAAQTEIEDRLDRSL